MQSNPQKSFFSEFGLRDEVSLNIGQGHSANAFVTAIKFYKDGDVTYDLNVQKDDGLITVQDVHFACLTKGWKDSKEKNKAKEIHPTFDQLIKPMQP